MNSATTQSPPKARHGMGFDARAGAGQTQLVFDGQPILATANDHLVYGHFAISGLRMRPLATD